MRIKEILFTLTILISSFLLCGACVAQDYSEWIKRCNPHRVEVESVLLEENVSLDFYYLMVAESKCTPKAKSNKGARGFWQLMPATAKHYGCADPDNLICATRAAARYIKSLSERFKTFNEVIAAYNIGGHNYLKRGITSEALGLIQRVNVIRRQDKEDYHVETD